MLNMISKFMYKAKRLKIFSPREPASSHEQFCPSVSIRHSDGHKRQNQASSQVCAHPVPLSIQEAQEKKLSIYSQIGVGVYQGEFVAILKWAFGNDIQSHRWLVYNMRSENLQNIQPQLVSQVHLLGCLLCLYCKRKLLSKMDLQSLIGQLQEIIDHEHMEQCNLESVNEHEISKTLAEKILLSETLQELMQQSNQRCLNCPFESIIEGER